MKQSTGLSFTFIKSQKGKEGGDRGGRTGETEGGGGGDRGGRTGRQRGDASVPFTASHLEEKNKNTVGQTVMSA